MSETNLDRLREDLAVMKQAVGMDPPLEWRHVWANLALATVGIAIAAMTVLTPIAHYSNARGSEQHLAYSLMLILPVLFVFTGFVVMAYRRKAVAPQAWRESRHSIAIAIFAVPLFVGFLGWALWSGVAAASLTAVTLFLAGLFPLMSAIVEPSRRYVLGWAISTLLAGACALWGSYENAGLLIGGWIFFGGLSTAVIVARQLRTGSSQDAN